VGALALVQLIPLDIFHPHQNTREVIPLLVPMHMLRKYVYLRIGIFRCNECGYVKNVAIGGKIMGA
jgi:hypothetical protein